jgi:hypothetical protein
MRGGGIADSQWMMAEEVTKFWRCLEDLRGLVHVPAGWRARLDGEFDAVRGAFLRARPGASARSYTRARVSAAAFTRLSGTMTAGSLVFAGASPGTVMTSR